MKIKDVFVLEEAVDDLEEGRAFYNLRESGVGEYFWGCLISDIESVFPVNPKTLYYNLEVWEREGYIKRKEAKDPVLQIIFLRIRYTKRLKELIEVLKEEINE